MRIGILTYHDANNFGCAAQCFGLQEAVKELFPEAEVEIINYGRGKGPRIVPAGSEDEPPFVRARVFERFRRNYMNIPGETVYDPDKLDPIPYDVCIVGSDQVWNDKLVRGQERAYFLTFAGNDTRKISYAASVGGTADDEERVGWLLEWLPKMDAISIREESSFLRLKQKTNLPMTVCVDPSLLHDRSFWESYEKKPERLGDEKYVFMYALGYGWCREYERRAAQMAADIAETYGLKVIHYYFGQLREWFPEDSKDCYCEGPQEILWLFHHAEYVVCCSFHGTAFSLIYEKPFYTFFVPDNGNRMKDLVTSLGIEERYIEDSLPKEEWDWEIPWDKVNAALQKKRDESLDYLRREIGAANE
ncbi:MAG: polysaccharide pyruvyl transferase family protein [Lachnospiraceae bacterium]|nr:polysaccharide pyruvyl transferase family protein [Lachnospiraceae bacterium]